MNFVLASATFWSRTRVFNPFSAFLLALMCALALRFLLLVVLERRRGVSVILFRFASGAILAGASYLYFLFTAPLLDWDRPARAVAAITLATVLLWVIIRQIRGKTTQPIKVVTGVLLLGLYALLLLTVTLTLIHVGYIALTGDRVTLLVSVTGDTRDEEMEWKTPAGKTVSRSVTIHRVKFTLPYGEVAADMWMAGDEISISGKAIHFSSTLNSLGIAQLYKLVSAHNGYLRPERQNAYPPQIIAFPETGILAVHPWWRPMQNRLLAFWAHHLGSHSWYSIQWEDNESAYYPLVSEKGKPVQQNFLLVLKTTGVATSRGSSPLENQQESRK